MSVDSAKAFLARMQSDAALRTRMGSAPSIEARWDIIRGEGFDFTVDELDSCMVLSEEELGQVTGGIGIPPLPGAHITMCKTCFTLRASAASTRTQW
jgi:predicted ribosomally synthesized peptide with nif11-like leader